MQKVLNCFDSHVIQVFFKQVTLSIVTIVFHVQFDFAPAYSASEGHEGHKQTEKAYLSSWMNIGQSQHWYAVQCSVQGWVVSVEGGGRSSGLEAYYCSYHKPASSPIARCTARYHTAWFHTARCTARYHTAERQIIIAQLSAAPGHSLILSLGGANTKVELLLLRQSLQIGCINVQAHGPQVNSTMLRWRLGWWTDNDLANLLGIQTSLLWPAHQRYVIGLSSPRFYLFHRHTHTQSLSLVTFTWWGSHVYCF